MITSEETNWVKVQGDSLYYLCNFSTNLKTVQNKKLFKIPRRKHSLHKTTIRVKCDPFENYKWYSMAGTQFPR